jgi:hypothetical protein
VDAKTKSFLKSTVAPRRKKRSTHIGEFLAQVPPVLAMAFPDKIDCQAAFFNALQVENLRFCPFWEIEWE